MQVHCGNLVILLISKCEQRRLAHASRPVCPLILLPPILQQRLTLHALRALFRTTETDG